MKRIFSLVGIFRVWVSSRSGLVRWAFCIKRYFTSR